MPLSADIKPDFTRRRVIQVAGLALAEIVLASCSGPSVPFLKNSSTSSEPSTSPSQVTQAKPSLSPITVIPQSFDIKSDRPLLSEFQQLKEDPNFVSWYYEQVVPGAKISFLDYTKVTNYLHLNNEVTIDDLPNGLNGRVVPEQGMHVRRLPDTDDIFVDRDFPWLNAGESFPFRSGLRFIGRDGYQRIWLIARYVTSDLDPLRIGANRYVFDFNATPEQLTKAGDRRILKWVAGRFGADSPFITPVYDDEYKPTEIPIIPKSWLSYPRG